MPSQNNVLKINLKLEQKLTNTHGTAETYNITYVNKYTRVYVYSYMHIARVSALFQCQSSIFHSQAVVCRCVYCRMKYGKKIVKPHVIKIVIIFGGRFRKLLFSCFGI